MKDIFTITKNLIKSLSSKIPEKSPIAELKPTEIENPDAILHLSNKVINELLDQNLPFISSFKLDSKRQVELIITAAEIWMNSGNNIELSITNATLKLEQTIFKIGLHSNIVVLRLNAGIVRKSSQFSLVANGYFSEFNFKYLPDWIAKNLKDLLSEKLLNPLVDFDIGKILSFEKQINKSSRSLQFNLIPEDVGLVIDRSGLNLQVRFSKMTQ